METLVTAVIGYGVVMTAIGLVVYGLAKFSDFFRD